MDKENYFEYSRKDVYALVPENYNKVLEIGCGKGTFRNHFVKQCEYWGIEPVENIAYIAKKSLDNVLIGTYEDVHQNIPDNYFDLIICNDVIEHMVDHDWFLQNIQKKMVENASLVGSIPNVRYLYNLYDLVIKKDWNYKDSGILDKTHLRFFTEKSLKKCFKSNGYKIEKFIYLHSLFSKNYTIGAILKKGIVFLIGKDTEYLQFGFRIKKAKK